jgi:hypothetical protein
MFTVGTRGALGGQLCPWQSWRPLLRALRGREPNAVHPVAEYDTTGLCLHDRLATGLSSVQRVPSLTSFVLAFTSTYSPWHLR